jgi:hypothetical protein
VLLLGHLERAGAGEIQPYEESLEQARREFDAYDGTPF